MTSKPVVRSATPADGRILLRLVDQLADYERLPRPDAAARERLLQHAFSEPPRFNAYLADMDGAPVGYAIAFEAYSSFLARPTLYLEDVFVLPARRGHGVARSILRFLAGEALRRGCGRMEWMVLTWNEAAIGFYDRIGARRLDDWVAYRLTEDDLRALARGPGG